MSHLEDPYDRYRTQYKRIRSIFAQHRGVELACDNLAAPSYVYDRDHLIVVDTPHNIDFVGRTFRGERIGRSLFGTQLMRVTRTGDDDARAALSAVKQGCGETAAGLNHLITVAEDVNLCPADEPYPVPPKMPEIADASAGRDVVIDVIDTGLAPFWYLHEWMAGIEPIIARPVDDSEGRGTRMGLGPGEAMPLDYGHGTFIGGILAATAPGARIRVANDFRDAGAETEIELRNALERTITQSPKPHIISLSAGATGQQALLGLEGVVKEVLRQGIVLVAAAGNNGNDTPFYPAALDGVISVGALRENYKSPACFSNFGPWVKVFAPGERLVNAFAYDKHDYEVQHLGRETCHFRRRATNPAWYACCTCVTTNNQHERITFQGMARWSGTSFATPIVAGLIAARMSTAGQSAVDAASWLLRHPAGRVESGVPIVLPGQSMTSRCNGSGDGDGNDCEGDC